MPASAIACGRGELDLEPRLVPALLAPDAAHLGVGVARNHAGLATLARSVKRELLPRQLEAVDVAEHGDAQRVAGEKLAPPAAARRRS